MSLGGYTSALIAGVDDRLQAVIPNVPVVTPDAAFDDWFPASILVKLGNRLSRTDEDLMAAASAFHSPLSYQPLVPKDRRLIITGLGDRLAPPEQAEMLWEHWDRCAFHWFPGNHIVHVSQPDYLRRMTRFMKDFMFV
jgi:pimeloyl-ACP methyl ester carboxylesterase